MEIPELEMHTLYSHVTDVAGAAPSFSTWDPALNPTLFTYSNGNKTALRNTTSLGNYFATRSSVAKSAGKLMFEVTCVNGPSNRIYFGFGCNASFPLDGSAFPGDTNINATAMLTDFNRQQFNGGSVSGTVFASSVVAGDVCSCCVHFGAGSGGGPLVWWRKNATGFWNGDATPADPATDTVGIDAFTSFIGPYFIILFASDNTDGFILNTGGSPFTDTLPSGYSAWG